MARPRKAKQHKEPESISHALEEIESLGDRLTNWMIENPRTVLAAGAVVLVVAGGWGLMTARRESAREDASAAVGKVQSDFARAMGAQAGDIVVAEPANPATAKKVREEYVSRFQEVAKQHPGTAGGAMAAFEVGTLQQKLDEPDKALETWKATLDEVPKNGTMAALISFRMAAVYEGQSRWVDAANAYERAANVPGFPLADTARAEAARCFAQAGDDDRALQLYQRIKTDSPDVYLPEALSARLQELQVAKRMREDESAPKKPETAEKAEESAKEAGTEPPAPQAPADAAKPGAPAAPAD